LLKNHDSKQPIFSSRYAISSLSLKTVRFARPPSSRQSQLPGKAKRFPESVSSVRTIGMVYFACVKQMLYHPSHQNEHFAKLMQNAFI
jgi:hypothetical protein